MIDEIVEFTKEYWGLFLGLLGINLGISICMLCVLILSGSVA